jgi:glycosyltransferase involved in cell wall biosynthesis
VLFVGKGTSGVCYYRCLLPAMTLGCDWVGVKGQPPRLTISTGLVGGETKTPTWSEYDVVVLQQPHGRGWKRMIRVLQEAGATVLYEIDDYLHGIPKVKGHDFRHQFTKETLRDIESAMRACDGLIVSTDYLAQRYASFNERVWVCRNGLDVARYRLSLPERETVNIVWAGGTGHKEGAHAWLTKVALLMREYEQVSVVTIGQPFADGLAKHFPGRALSIPWTLIEIYPGAMTHGDIAIAPAGKGLWFKAKSDLRWLEAGALGIPIVADPDVYPDIEHGVTGFHARGAGEAVELLEDLVLDRSLRLQVGANAREWVHEHRTIAKMAPQWMEVFRAARSQDRAADAA